MFKYDTRLRAELWENWPVLAIAFCCFLFGTSAPAFSLPFLFPEVIREFGWTRESATLLASSKYAAGAVASLFVGRLVDRVGAWVSLILMIGLGGGAMISFLWMSDLGSYYLAGTLLGICGSGGTVAITVLISRVFHASQGTAVGLALLGTSLGSVVWPLLAALSMSYLGWRVGFASLSVGIWLLVLPLLVACLVMPSLQSLGQGPAPVQTKDSKSEEGNGYSISRLVRARPFWTLAMALFVTALVDQALIQHQVMMFDDIGMTFKWAAFGVSAIGLMSFFLRAFVGNILDAGSNKALAILYTTLSLSALIALWLTSPVMLLLYLLFRSVAHTVVVIDIPVMTKHIFGTENLGTLVGLFSFFTYAGFAIGPWVMGRMFDATGSYVYSIVGFVVLPLIASGLVWNLEPKHWLAINAQGAKPQ